MKRTLFFSIVLLGSYALAQMNQGGFVDGEPSQVPIQNIVSPYNIIKVSETQILPDNTYVSLEGFITGPDNESDNETYIFQDSSDSIRIEIDPQQWRGQIVTPKTKIRVLGELEVNMRKNTRKLEVKYLTIIGTE